eukprot:m.140180 g.140180  ORF g.140180 m.140180 type:complete len:830 (-) comp16105_c0_seq2:183-2672(-)
MAHHSPQADHLRRNSVSSSVEHSPLAGTPLAGAAGAPTYSHLGHPMVASMHITPGAPMVASTAYPFPVQAVPQPMVYAHHPMGQPMYDPATHVYHSAPPSSGSTSSVPLGLQQGYPSYPVHSNVPMASHPSATFGSPLNTDANAINSLRLGHQQLLSDKVHQQEKMFQLETRCLQAEQDTRQALAELRQLKTTSQQELNRLHHDVHVLSQALLQLMEDQSYEETHVLVRSLKPLLESMNPHKRRIMEGVQHGQKVKPTDVVTWLQDAHKASPLNDGTEHSSETELILQRSFSEWRLDIVQASPTTLMCCNIQDSALVNAGLREGDIIRAINGMPAETTSSASMQALLKNTDSVCLQVRRGLPTNPRSHSQASRMSRPSTSSDLISQRELSSASLDPTALASTSTRRRKSTGSLKPTGAVYSEKRRPSGGHTHGTDQLSPYYGDGASASSSRRTSGAAPSQSTPTIHVEEGSGRAERTVPSRGRPQSVANPPRNSELDKLLGTVVADTNAYFERTSKSAGFTVTELSTRVTNGLCLRAFVLAVDVESRANSSGLMVGDEIMSLNGAPLSKMTDQELRYWLETGVRFSLSLQRRADPGQVLRVLAEARGNTPPPDMPAHLGQVPSRDPSVSSASQHTEASIAGDDVPDPVESATESAPVPVPTQQTPADSGSATSQRSGASPSTPRRGPVDNPPSAAPSGGEPPPSAMVSPQPAPSMDFEMLRLAESKVAGYQKFYRSRLGMPVIAVRLNKEEPDEPMGVELGPDPTDARRNVVTSVAPDSAADRCGFLQHDIVCSVGRVDVLKAKREVAIKLLNQRKERNVYILLARQDT